MPFFSCYLEQEISYAISPCYGQNGPLRLQCFDQEALKNMGVFCVTQNSHVFQRYTYRMLQAIQMKLMFLCVWAEPAVLGSTKTAPKFKYEL